MIDDPALTREMLMEIVAVLVRRAGGYVAIGQEEAPKGPFDLMSRVGGGLIELKLHESALQ